MDVACNPSETFNMTKVILSIATIFLMTSIHVYGQRTELYNSKDEFYKKTNFNIIDTLDKWVFNIDTSYKGRPSDSVKPIGAITFIRATPLFDEKYYKANNKLWRPYFSFEIFLLSDSAFCINDSKNTRMFSSCLPPFTGGDILFIGNLILVNRRVCNAFSIKWDTDTDFARPVINKVLSTSSLSKIYTFQDFINELPIKGKLL
jgi:hypothetical protein